MYNYTDNEDREEHLNTWFEMWYPVLRKEPHLGPVPEAVVCGLVNMAKMIAKEQAQYLPDNYFDTCVREVLKGRDGLILGE